LGKVPAWFAHRINSTTDSTPTFILMLERWNFTVRSTI
jgi:hypothetical protein